MRNSLAFLILGSTMLATPALARNGAWYVGGDFGGMIVEDTNIDLGFGGSVIDKAVTFDNDTGFDGALFVGYDLGAFRLEAEVSYKKAGVGDISTDIFLPGSISPGTYPADSGNSSALSFMVNSMLDFGPDDGLSGFIGGGVGQARVSFSNVRVFSNAPAFLDDSDTAFAWQVLAGVRYPVGSNVDLTARYRFFNVNSLTFDDGSDRGKARWRSHSVLAGITYNFGGPPPPPPVYVPPPPPPPSPP